MVFAVGLAVDWLQLSPPTRQLCHGPACRICSVGSWRSSAISTPQARIPRQPLPAWPAGAGAGAWVPDPPSYPPPTPSWSRLQHASSTILTSKPASEHELPLWHQPPTKMPSSSPHSQPSAAASPPPPPVVPPAPITASIHASTARLRQNRALPDSMVLLRRQEKQLHDDLQDLLYQQDEALRVAAGGTATTAHDEADLSASATPTVRSLADSKRLSADDNRHHKQQRHANIGVRAVRKAIRSAIRQLAAVKAEEGRLLGHDRAGNDAVVRKLAGWAEQKDGLETQIRAIEQGDEGAHTTALKGEAHALEGEIRELEDKLHAARARHRKLLADVAEIENSVQSKLSSYKASLSILEADINAFLRNSSARDRQASEAPFFQIPPKRRTLDLAKEHWDEEQANIEKLRQESETERDALEQGAVVWNDVVHRINDFEKHITEATMHQSSSTDPTAEAKDLVAHLTETINYVESQLESVEERGWKLLVACIGAELSALHEGRRMLEAMLQAAGETSPTIEREKRLGDVEIEFQPSSLANSQTLQNGEPGEATAPKQVPARQPRPDYHSTDEDEPDPELLISHQDTDDEHIG